MEDRQTYTKELERTLLQSIKSTKLKLQRFQALDLQHKSVERCHSSTTLRHQTQTKPPIKPIQPTLSPNLLFKEAQQSAKQVSKPVQKQLQLGYRSKQQQLLAKPKQSEALVKALTALKQKNQQLEEQLRKHKEQSLTAKERCRDFQAELGKLCQFSRSKEQELASLQTEGEALRETVKSREREAEQYRVISQQLSGQLRQSEQRQRKLADRLKETQAHLLEAKTLIQAKQIEVRDMKMQCQKANEIKFQASRVQAPRRNTEGQAFLLSQQKQKAESTALVRKKLKKTERWLLEVEGKMRSTQNKIAVYRSIFADLQLKAGKAPGLLSQAIKAASLRIGRLEGEPALASKQERRESVSRSESKSRSKSKRKVIRFGQDNFPNSTAKGKSRECERSIRSKSSESSFSRSNGKKMMSSSAKRSGRRVLDELNKEKEELLTEEIKRLELVIAKAKRESEDCFRELNESGKSDRDFWRAKLNEVSQRLTEHTNELKQLKKQRREAGLNR